MLIHPLCADPRQPPRQVCGGNGNHKGCDGTCDSALALDECGVCGGDGTACKAEGLFKAESHFMAAAPRLQCPVPNFLPWCVMCSAYLVWFAMLELI